MGSKAYNPTHASANPGNEDVCRVPCSQIRCDRLESVVVGAVSVEGRRIPLGTGCRCDPPRGQCSARMVDLDHPGRWPPRSTRASLRVRACSFRVETNYWK